MTMRTLLLLLAVPIDAVGSIACTIVRRRRVASASTCAKTIERLLLRNVRRVKAVSANT